MTVFGGRCYDLAMTKDLSTWIDRRYAAERDEASALQRLLTCYEPGSEPEKIAFSAALLALLQESVTHGAHKWHWCQTAQ